MDMSDRSGAHSLRPAILLFSVLCVSVLFLTVVPAAFGGGGGGGEGHPSIFQAYFWPVINFFVLIAVLAFMFKKMDLKGYFRKRTELIEQTLREAQEAKALAQKALDEVEERLRMKDSEIAEIVASSRESGDKEKARLIAEGEKLKAKILDQAETNISYELKRAKEAIKAEAVELAMELAEKKLRDKLSKEEQERLLEESLAKIEGKK